MREGTQLMEQPCLKALIFAALDYFTNQHGAIVLKYVRDWLEGRLGKHNVKS